MIFGRPLKKVREKILPFGKDETIHVENLGKGDASDGTYLRGDGSWAEYWDTSNSGLLFGGVDSIDEDVYKLQGGVNGVSLNSGKLTNE